MPPELHECEDSRPTVRAKCFIAYTGSSGSLRDLVFEAVELEGLNVQGQWSSDTKWEDIRWDLETSSGGNQPRDMLFGFQVFSMTPMFRKGGLQAALERLASREWTGFENLKRLKGTDNVNQGMWIAIVRLPRAVGARTAVPFNRRKDVLQLQVDIVMGGWRGEKAAERIAEIRKTTDGETHPVDGELRTLPNGALFAKPLKFVTCTRCGAQCHHTALSHDDVYMPADACCTLEPLSWLQAPPLEEERLALPVAKEGKGIEFSLRNVTQRIPLRTARALKLMGMDVEGDIPACGVQQVRNQFDVQRGSSTCSHGKEGHECCCCTALLAPSKTCTHGRNSFCCCCAAIRCCQNVGDLEMLVNELEFNLRD